MLKRPSGGVCNSHSTERCTRTPLSLGTSSAPPLLLSPVCGPNGIPLGTLRPWEKAGYGFWNCKGEVAPRAAGSLDPHCTPTCTVGEGEKAISSTYPPPAPTAALDSQGPEDAADAGEIIRNRQTKGWIQEAPVADDGFYCWGLLGIPAPPRPQDFSLYSGTQAESPQSRVWGGAEKRGTLL